VSDRPHWLTEEIRVRRGAALICIALAGLTLLNWTLTVLLWILQHTL
jgi:hypothetical protein